MRNEKSHWEEYPREEHRKKAFTSLKTVQKYLNEKKGNANALIRSFVTCFDTALSCACGDGSAEAAFKRNYGIKSIYAFDIAHKTLAKSPHKGNGDVRMFVGDANALGLRRGVFDVIFCYNAAHHFSGLELAFARMRDSLKPNGIFILNDYIGPNRLQHTEQTLAVCNAILDRLPDSLKRLNEKEVKIARRMPLHAISEHEAIRSEDIEGVFNATFNVVYQAKFNKILMPLLNEIAQNFNEKDEAHLALLKLMTLFDDALEQDRSIPHLQIFAIGKK